MNQSQRFPGNIRYRMSYMRSSVYFI